MQPGRLPWLCLALRGAAGALQLRGGEEAVDLQDKPEVSNREKLVPDVYAPVKFTFGESVEGKTKDGGWVPATVIGFGEEFGFYHIHVSDDFPGYDLPSVPYELLRRMLRPGEMDFLVDNSQLQHRGKGLKYRYSKSMEDAGGEYAPWGTVIVGEDEGDGWVRTDRGYFLPFVIHERQVLVRKERDTSKKNVTQNLTSGSNSFTGIHSIQQPVKDEPPPLQSYVVGERTQFRTKGGEWYPCRVTSLGKELDTYNIVVLPNEFAVYPVSNVPYRNLRKIGPPAPRKLKEGEAKACQKEGCVLLRVRTQQGREFLLQVSKRSKLDMLMKMVCNRMKIEWGNCQSQFRFMKDGEQVSPWTHVMLSGLHDHDLITMEDIPVQEPEHSA